MNRHVEKFQHVGFYGTFSKEKMLKLIFYGKTNFYLGSTGGFAFAIYYL